jgi:hypothetical protein
MIDIDTVITMTPGDSPCDNWRGTRPSEAKVKEAETHVKALGETSGSRESETKKEMREMRRG